MEAHRKLLGADELYGMPLDGMQGGIGSVARVGRGRRGQGHVGLAALCNLDPSDCHQLHQLQIQKSTTAVTLTHPHRRLTGPHISSSSRLQVQIPSTNKTQTILKSVL